MSARRAADARAGFVLVTVLWMLTLLGGLAAAMSLFTARTLAVIDVSADRARAEAAVTAGVNMAAATVLVDPRPMAQPASLAVGKARVRWRAVGEAARIDLNMAPAPLLAGLFAQLGASGDAAAGYAATIVALRGLPPAQDQGQGQGQAQGQAQTPTAAAAGAQPGSDPDDESPAAIARLAQPLPKPGERDPHKPFVEVGQLQQVPGLPAALMEKAAPFLTTFSGKAGIDVRLAAPEVLAALPGLTRERLRTILELRGRPDDDEQLKDALAPAKAFVTDEPALAVRVRVDVVLPDGFTTAAEAVIVQHADDRTAYRVLSWDDDIQTRALTLKGAAP